MDEPATQFEPPSPDDLAWPATERPWVERVRPWLKWSVPVLLIAAALAAGLPFGGWRSPVQVALSTDPLALLPGLRPALGPVSLTIAHALTAAAFAVAVGALTWVWRGGTPGYGFFAACAAFSLSLLIELSRWLKPGQLPDLQDPLIAFLVAPVVWRLLRLVPTQPVTPLPRYGPCRTRRRILVRFVLGFGGIGVAAGLVCAVLGIRQMGLAPSGVALLVTNLPEGRAGASGTIARIIAGTFDRSGIGPWLRAANRIDRTANLPLPAWSGAGEAHDGVLPPGRPRPVATIETLRQAIESAAPGDVILLQPGVYRIGQSYITAARPGTAEAPITVRAPRSGTVTLESETPEAIKVAAPHWHFENLVLKGVCPKDDDCDNGFHIVGRAEHTVIRNLRIEEFNAQIKINGENGYFPDHGRIERSTLVNSRIRHTSAPVTPVDLVAASGWVIEDNLIADFVKDAGNLVSYGAFAKGAGRGTVFNRNVVLCEWRLRAPKGQTIGLSFGGGATGSMLMRDLGRSGYEQADGTMTGNLIAFCSDVGIYLNRAANSVIRHNTLIGTAGIDVRYPESIAQVEGNVVDGAIRARDDALLWEDANDSGTLMGMYLGRNPVRSLFADPARLDLRWKRLPTLVETEPEVRSGPWVRAGPGTDLCGAEWTALSPAGAFRDFRACGGTEKP